MGLSHLLFHGSTGNTPSVRQRLDELHGLSGSCLHSLQTDQCTLSSPPPPASSALPSSQTLIEIAKGDCYFQTVEKRELNMAVYGRKGSQFPRLAQIGRRDADNRGQCDQLEAARDLLHNTSLHIRVSHLLHIESFLIAQCQIL